MTTKSKTPDKTTRLVSASWPKRVAKMSHFGTPGKSRIAQNRNFEARFVLGHSKKSKKVPHGTSKMHRKIVDFWDSKTMKIVLLRPCGLEFRFFGTFEQIWTHFGPQKITILVNGAWGSSGRFIHPFCDFVRASKITDFLIPLWRFKKTQKFAQDAAKRLKKFPGGMAAWRFRGIWAPGAARARLCTRY